VYAFLNLDFGRGSAAAMIGGAVILVVGLGMLRALDRLVEVSQ
jgi:multiple sugar transport system permease protein